jgi:hypothetical protein
MTVGLTASDVVTASRPSELFQTHVPGDRQHNGTSYAATADGRRFLVPTAVGRSAADGGHGDSELGAGGSAVTARVRLPLDMQRWPWRDHPVSTGVEGAVDRSLDEPKRK